MTRIDQFESVFKAAARTVYTYERIVVRKVLVVTDLADADAERYGARVRGFLAELEGREADVQWQVTSAAANSTVGDLLELLESAGADLVATYRNLHSGAWRWPHSLGDHLDVLTQTTATPVLVLPRPEQDWEAKDTDSVLALTDHLTGDARLVNYAVRFTARDGELCLAHIEDEPTFERYLDVIGKIPEIDTDTARERIAHQLLKEPTDYIVSCKEVLRREQRPIRLAKVIAMGHHLADLERLIADRQANLLVINTKDDDQSAMHGLAYPLAVELRSTPILML